MYRRNNYGNSYGNRSFRGGSRKRSRYGNDGDFGRKRHTWWKDAPYHWQRNYWQHAATLANDLPVPPPQPPPPPPLLSEDPSAVPNFNPSTVLFEVTDPPEHEEPEGTRVDCTSLAAWNGGTPLPGVSWEYEKYLGTGVDSWVTAAREEQNLPPLTVHRSLISTAVPIAVFYGTQDAYDSLQKEYFNLVTDYPLYGFHPYTDGYERVPGDTVSISARNAATEYGGYTASVVEHPTGEFASESFYLHWYSKVDESPLDAWERIVENIKDPLSQTVPEGRGMPDTIYRVTAAADPAAERILYSGFGSAPLPDTLDEADPFKGGHSNVLFVATPPTEPDRLADPLSSPFEPPVDDPIAHYNYAGFACEENPNPASDLPSGQLVGTYNPTDVNVTSGSPVADPNDWNPDTRGCNEYSVPEWPLLCPQELTWNWMQTIMAPVMAEMNGYRTANSLDPLTLDYGLCVMAFAHATYFTENWQGYLTGSPTFGSKTHFEPPADPLWDFDPAMPDGWGEPWNTENAAENVVGSWSRARYFGFEPANQVAEGIGNMGGKVTPMQLFCTQIDSDGHRKPYVEQGDFLYVGFGFDFYEAALGNRTQGVFNYSPFPTTSLDPAVKDLYEWFPKFACQGVPTTGEFEWGDGDDPTYDHDSGWLASKPATALFTGYETAVPIPDQAGCANYDANDYWPLGCAQTNPRTVANYELAFQQCLDFGNWFRANLPTPLGPVQWSNACCLAAQAHATFVCEHWNEYYIDGQRGWYTGPEGGSIHYEPPQGFGYSSANRIKYFGGDTIGNTSEGVGETTEGNHNPMNFFCAQKSDWVSLTNPGHFATFYSEGTVGITCNYLGIGYDWNPVTNRMIWVIDYCGVEPQQFAGGDIPDVLPKFACPP